MVICKYLDIVPHNPDLTPKEHEERIREADKENAKLTDWPEIF